MHDDSTFRWRDVAIGFAIGLAIVGGLMVAAEAGWATINFRRRGDRVLFSIPVLTAIVLPMVLTAGRMVLVRMFPRPRPRPMPMVSEEPEAEPQAETGIVAQGTVAPRPAGDRYAALRDYIHRRAADGASDDAIIEELVEAGYPADEAVGWVRSETGRRSMPLTYEVEPQVTGIGYTVHTAEHSLTERFRRLERRRKRQGSPEDVEPNPDFQFNDPPEPDAPPPEPPGQ